MRQVLYQAGAGLRRCPVALVVALAFPGAKGYAKEAIEFNTDVLDISDRSHIDLSQFSQAGYIMPGKYQMVIRLNKAELPEQTLAFIKPDNDPQGSQVCLTPQVIAQLGLKASALRDLRWWHNGQCLDTASLPGGNRTCRSRRKRALPEYSPGVSGIYR
jgi:outer membrane usher protein PapC